MKLTHFFIDRPIFAAVISILIALIGTFGYFTLPVAQYPDIAPPQIVVSASFPGATPEVLADTVATPLEQQINGVKDMLYLSSSSTADGQVAITVTFKLGTNLDTDQVLTQNRVSTAEPRLPEVTRNLGVTVRQSSAGFLAAVSLYSPDKSLDIGYVGNYANTLLRDRLLRVQGVGDITLFGGSNYAMRIWLDPEKAAARNLNAEEIVAALQAQNVQVSAGSLNAPPFAAGGGGFQVSVTTEGRLTTPEQFDDIVIKNDGQGRITRVRDIGYSQLGRENYATQGYYNGQPCVTLGITQQPGTNALGAARALNTALVTAKKAFPKGLNYAYSYTPTDYIQASVDEVEKTLAIALLLVVIVVIVFLQSWRAAIIPVLAIPVSLLGAVGALAAFGFSLNNLSLFGLVLAIGIVVDDAIVVVENVERNLEEGLSPRDAAYRTMDEVSGALIAIALVLSAVFIPTALITGISGQFYKQFAVTIASATITSLIVSLTLSPALAALLLKPRPKEKEGAPPRKRGLLWPLQRGADLFNEGFARLSRGFGGLTGRLVRLSVIVLLVYGALLAVTVWRFGATPAGFIPDQNQGFLIGVVQMAPGSSLDRTDAVMRTVEARLRAVKGVEDATSFAGLDGATFSAAPNAGTMFVRLATDAQMSKLHVNTASVTDALHKASMGVDALVLLIPPPSVPGIGNGQGFKLILENQAGAGYAELTKATFAMMGAAQQTHGVTQVFSSFNTVSPQIHAQVDRVKAEMLGVNPSQVFNAMQTYLGSQYINDFNFLGRTFQVTAQADAKFRKSLPDIANLKTRSSNGGMVPIGSVANFTNDSGPIRVVRYNVFPAVEIQGATPPGYSTGQSLQAMEQLAHRVLPSGIGYEWTELAYQEKAAGNTAIIAFSAAVVFVFLLLAAQYESLTLPLAVILIVPMCLFAAILGVDARGLDNNILTQIGFVVLIGLAAKNAILIVEFAKQAEENGQDRFEAAVTAARERLRPILMTSFAFILGTLPLVIATGPGHELRQALGTAVFFGMIGVTLFGLLFTPTFYVVCRWLGLHLPRTRDHDPDAAPGKPATPPDGPDRPPSNEQGSPRSAESGSRQGSPA